MRILCTGSRKFTREDLVRGALFLATAARVNVTIVHGACPKGADAIVDKVANEMGLKVERHPADWRTGNAAGQIRNTKMVKLGAEKCLAFWDGNSKGTRDCLSKAARAGIPVQVVPEKAKGVYGNDPASPEGDR